MSFHRRRMSGGLGGPGRRGQPGRLLPSGVLGAFARLISALRTMGALGAATVLAGVGIFAVVPSVAAGAATAASQPAQRGPMTLVSQSPWVTPGQPFNISVAVGSAATAGPLLMHLSLYDHLTARSTFEGTTQSGTPAGGLLDTAGPAPVTVAGGIATLSVPVRSSGPPPSPFALDLHCTQGSCSGVYPIEVTLQRATSRSGSGSGATVGRLLTYLTYDESNLTAPGKASGPGALRVAVVTPFETPVTVDGASTNPLAELPAPPHRTVDDLESMATQIEASGVPVTVSTNGRTVQALYTRGGRDGRATVAALSALSAGTLNEVLTPSYVPIDAGALAGAGLTGEVKLQEQRGYGVLSQLKVHSLGGTYITGPDVGSDLGRAVTPLAQGQRVSPGNMNVVMPDTTLATPDDNLTWSQPFTLDLGNSDGGSNGTTVTAAAADKYLTAHFAADKGDPVLAANQLLADLAFIHYERPSVTYARGVVALPPPNWTPNPTFLATLLRGLSHNPLVEPVTLNTYFSTLPEHTLDTSGTRRLATGGSGPVLAAGVTHAVATQRLRISGFASAAGSTGVTNAIDDTLLAAESSSLRPQAKATDVAVAKDSLNHQLGMVQLTTDRTITLTARNSPIPVTVTSNLPYSMRAWLTLSSDKFEFQGPGSSKLSSDSVWRKQMNIDRATNPQRIQALARTSGDLPVYVTLTSPSYGLVIAQGHLTVRSTATSLVGIVLTALALAVLLGWWARTWWRGRMNRARARESA